MPKCNLKELIEKYDSRLNQFHLNINDPEKNHSLMNKEHLIQWMVLELIDEVDREWGITPAQYQTLVKHIVSKGKAFINTYWEEGRVSSEKAVHGTKTV